MSADNTMLHDDPHRDAPLEHAGARLDAAHSAVVMLHGRGASAEGILSLAAELRVPGIAYVAPQASGNAWYPLSFLAPVDRNEPWLSSALAAVGRAVGHCREFGIAPERLYLLGFSQGACLATEWVARNAGRYGGVFALSGGLIGDDATPRDYPGRLDGTPVLLGCSDVDPHVPAKRVEETARVLGAMGGAVDLRLYPGLGHTVNQDEIAAIVGILERGVHGPGRGLP